MKPYYDKDGITIYHGDCRDVLPMVPAGIVDLVLTDPPYGISHKSNGQRFVRSTPIEGDSDTSLAEWVIDWSEGFPLAMFFSPYAPLVGWRSVLVWDKGEHVGIGGDRETCWKRDFELIGVRGNLPLAGKRESAILRYPALLPPPTGHFAEKPVSLLSKLIIKLGGTVILDPFMGSGSTLRAAKNLGLQAIGIEVEEKWCEIAANRLAQGVLAFPE